MLESELLLSSYIAYGVPHFVTVKEAIVSDYIIGKMSQSRYHYNLRLLRTYIRDCDKPYN